MINLKNFEIEIIDNPDFQTIENYSKYFGKKENVSIATTIYGIKVMEQDKIINSALLFGFEGQTGINKNSYIIDNDNFSNLYFG
jgi:hypothetical protein